MSNESNFFWFYGNRLAPIPPGTEEIITEDSIDIITEDGEQIVTEN